METHRSASWRRPLAVNPEEMAQLKNLVEQEFAPEELALLAQDYSEVSLHELSPTGAFSIQIVELLRYAEGGETWLACVLLTHMARARPDGSELKNSFNSSTAGWITSSAP